ncbi:hypothetical protein RLDS_26255 [Sphingobium lactosutens DS20]|uniref:GIY-YIG domain-containing protein n=1 Tax=Sphingobium lactosutens DS20 TaxID=1331060 RepID=T0H3K0_9SPHN|nr:hypothetical protein RLDS_26255 [Sphingobium lactosutens DS20]
MTKKGGNFFRHASEGWHLRRWRATIRYGARRLHIAREKALKAWKREWKIRLIEASNPDWRDLSDLIA